MAIDVQSMAVTVPLWPPLVFVGYAIGRRQLTVRFAVTLAIAQLAAVGIAYVVGRKRLAALSLPLCKADRG